MGIDAVTAGLHPDFPVVSGDYLMTTGWLVSLPEQFNRRIEDGSLVLWRPELTFWINVWNNDNQLTVAQQLDAILNSASDDRSEQQIDRDGAIIRLTYALTETDPERADAQSRSISGYVISSRGYAQISAYYDTAGARTLGYKVIHSVVALP